MLFRERIRIITAIISAMLFSLGLVMILNSIVPSYPVTINRVTILHRPRVYIEIAVIGEVFLALGILGILINYKLFFKTLLLSLSTIMIISIPLIFIDLRNLALHNWVIIGISSFISEYLVIITPIISILILALLIMKSKAPLKYGIGISNAKLDPISDILLIFAIAIIVFSIPYIPLINPRGIIVDVDYHYYSEALDLAKDSPNPLHTVITWGRCVDRPLFMLFIYAISSIMSFEIFDKIYMIVSLALFIVLVNVVSKVLRLRYGWLVAMLSPITVGFMYGGFHANLMSLNISLLALYLSFKKRITTPILSLISSLIHSEAWLFHTVLFTYDPKSLMLWIVPGSIWWLFRSIFIIPTCPLLESFISGITNDLHFILNIYLWGTFSNWLFYLLVIIGIIIMYRKHMNYLIPTLLSMSFLVIPLIMFRELILRVIMNSVMWIPISRALASIKSREFLVFYTCYQLLFVVFMLVNAVPRI